MVNLPLHVHKLCRQRVHFLILKEHALVGLVFGLPDGIRELHIDVLGLPMPIAASLAQI